MSLSKPTRRKFLAGAMLAGTGCLGLAGDGLLHAARDLVLEQLEVRLSRLPPAFDGFSIVQMSDFHYDNTFARPIIESAVTLANSVKPDLIVLTGDYVTQPYRHKDDREAARNAEPCAELLARMTSRLGTYAVLGNHDNTDPEHVAAALESYHITVLRNRSVPIEHQGARLWLAGLADVLARKADANLALRGIPIDEPTVLLVHEPDYAEHVHKDRVDLQLSGHSHGGQIVFPLIGPPYLPQLARKYWRGLYKLGPMTLYTNRGLGTIWLPMRLNAQPEITLFTLKTLK